MSTFSCGGVKTNDVTITLWPGMRRRSPGAPRRPRRHLSPPPVMNNINVSLEPLTTTTNDRRPVEIKIIVVLDCASAES